MTRPAISVVVPVYGCAPCLTSLHARVTAVLEGMNQSHELILIDDRSPDEAWDVIDGLARSDPRVRGVHLSRNFGQHAAITAGLSHARGDWVVVMDCDLQDPPEEIPKLYAKASEGYEVVLGRRRETRLPAHRRVLSRAYFRLLSAFTGVPFDGSHGTFSVISRKVVESFLRFRDQDRHYLFILNWLGFRQTTVDYAHSERESGKSSYSLGRLISHALDGMFFQTTVILRWIVGLGFVMAAISAALAVYFVIARVTATAYPGWTSLAVLTLGVGGFIVISTGITGIYVGKVFDQVKDRPLFVVDRVSWATEDPLLPVAMAGEREREHADVDL